MPGKCYREDCESRHIVDPVNWVGKHGDVQLADWEHDPELFSQISDSEDLGFVLVNGKRGTRVVMRLMQDEVDSNGVIRKWFFEPTPTSVQDNPNLEGITLTVHSPEDW